MISTPSAGTTANRWAGVHPADLTTLEGRFAAPLHPGETARILIFGTAPENTFELLEADTPVISAGKAVFAEVEGR